MQSVFMLDPKDTERTEKLGPDGLPHIGIYLDKGDPYYRYWALGLSFALPSLYCKELESVFFYSYFNAEEGKYVVAKFLGAERAYVDSVKLKGNDTGTMEMSNVVITIRIPVRIHNFCSFFDCLKVFLQLCCNCIFAEKSSAWWQICKSCRSERDLLVFVANRRYAVLGEWDRSGHSVQSSRSPFSNGNRYTSLNCSFNAFFELQNATRF